MPPPQPVDRLNPLLAEDVPAMPAGVTLLVACADGRVLTVTDELDADTMELAAFGPVEAAVIAARLHAVGDLITSDLLRRS